MEVSKKYKRVWIIIVAVASIALILTSFLPYLLMMQ